MRIKSFIAAARVLAVLAAFLAFPVLAQQKAFTGSPVAPVCANCHESQWTAIDLTPHGAKSDANGSMCQACHGDASEHLVGGVDHPPLAFDFVGFGGKCFHVFDPVEKGGQTRGRRRWGRAKCRPGSRQGDNCRGAEFASVIF